MRKSVRSGLGSRARWVSRAMLAASIVSALMFAGCSKDDDDDDDSSSGGLSGTTWERKSTSKDWDFTYSITFKSATEMSYNQKGWGMVGNKKNNYDETTNGTYEYFPDIKEGIIYCTRFTANMLVFAISDDFRTLRSKTGGDPYTKR